ncbi:hypothetical protein EDB84DRAFT_1471916 [Lactarius hengduanensis]|nr:hypothetical protein EDB84DRAFT_1471916 [Lactarius hengduanensis]
MFHPNVYANGELCLDILQNRWSPTYDLYRENMKEYVRRVRATVEDSWLEDDEKAAVGEGGAQ